MCKLCGDWMVIGRKLLHNLAGREKYYESTKAYGEWLINWEALWFFGLMITSANKIRLVSDRKVTPMEYHKCIELYFITICKWKELINIIYLFAWHHARDVCNTYTEALLMILDEMYLNCDDRLEIANKLPMNTVRVLQTLEKVVIFTSHVWTL